MKLSVFSVLKKPYAIESTMSDSDEQIEEFDTDDEGSGAEPEPEPITAKFVSRPVAVKNALPPSKPIKFKGKGSEKKITINIKTDLIVEPPKIEQKSPEKKTEDVVISEEKSAEVVEGEKKPEKLEEPMEVEKKTEPSTDAAPDYAKHLSYEGSLCVYTEPGTNRQLIWKAEENAWVSRTGENSSDDTTKAEESEGQIRG